MEMLLVLLASTSGSRCSANLRMVRLRSSLLDHRLDDEVEPGRQVGHGSNRLKAAGGRTGVLRGESLPVGGGVQRHHHTRNRRFGSLEVQVHHSDRCSSHGKSMGDPHPHRASADHPDRYARHRFLPLLVAVG